MILHEPQPFKIPYCGKEHVECSWAAERNSACPSKAVPGAAHAELRKLKKSGNGHSEFLKTFIKFHAAMFTNMAAPDGNHNHHPQAPCLEPPLENTKKWKLEMSTKVAVKYVETFILLPSTVCEQNGITFGLFRVPKLENMPPKLRAWRRPWSTQNFQNRIKMCAMNFQEKSPNSKNLSPTA